MMVCGRSVFSDEHTQTWDQLELERDSQQFFSLKWKKRKWNKTEEMMSDKRREMKKQVKWQRMINEMLW